VTTRTCSSTTPRKMRLSTKRRSLTRRPRRKRRPPTRTRKQPGRTATATPAAMVQPPLPVMVPRS